MNPIYRFSTYLRHITTAIHTGGHGIHSPFLFDFIRNIVMEKNPYYCFDEIEKQRKALANNRSRTHLPEAGAGTLATAARTGLKRARLDQVLFRMCVRYKFNNVLEVGNSLGVTTLYLLAAGSKMNCVCACNTLPEITRSQPDISGRKNVRLETIASNADLAILLESVENPDLIVISGSSQPEQIADYFGQCVNFIHSNSIIVIDAPYRQAETARVWTDIKHHPQVKASIDLYHWGVVFFDPAFANRHYRVLF